VGFGFYDHWRDVSEQRTLAEAVAAAKAEAAREVEHLRGESA
jgi:hypothetical protein